MSRVESSTPAADRASVRLFWATAGATAAALPYIIQAIILQRSGDSQPGSFDLPGLLVILLPLTLAVLFFARRLHLRGGALFERVVDDLRVRLADVLDGEETLRQLCETAAIHLDARWVEVAEQDEGWSETWPSVISRDSARPPLIQVPFDDFPGLELRVGPPERGRVYRADKERLATVLVAAAQPALGRDVLRRWVLDEAAERDRLTEEGQLKDDLLMLVSHDLRGPLSSITLDAGRLARSDDADLDLDALRGGFERIQRSARRLAGMVDRLLRMVRLEAGLIVPRPTSLKVSELFARLEERFAPLARERSVELQYEDSGAGKITADVDLLTEAVSNLVDNAVRHTREGGQVTVTLEQDRDAVWISVRDEGTGVPADQVSRLFTPRTSAERSSSSESYGLGLYLTRRVAELLGGGVRLSRTGSSGSEFILRLPAP